MLTKHNYNLQSVNTLALPSVAKYFSIIEHEEQIPNLDFKDSIIIGGGSNIILPQEVHHLYHIQLKNSDIEEKKEGLYIQVGAGEVWHNIVEKTVDLGYGNIANLALIPGYVGASVIQNIGAYGIEVSSIVQKIRAWDKQLRQWTEFSRDQCQFHYRDSIFKQHKDRYIITELYFFLAKLESLDAAYQDIQNYIDKHSTGKITPRHIYNAVCAIRKLKLPDYNLFPNAGSFFKNIIIDDKELERILAILPEIIHYKYEKMHKISTANLLERLGYKGKYNKYGIGMSEKHALILINKKAASSMQLQDFYTDILHDVYKKTGLKLEVEPISYISGS